MKSELQAKEMLLLISVQWKKISRMNTISLNGIPLKIYIIEFV